MLIECKLKRKKGSSSSFNMRDGSVKTYRFLPLDPNGKFVPNTNEDPEAYKSCPHIAEVNAPKHIRQFLSIDSYKPFGKDSVEEASVKYGYGEDDEADDADEDEGPTSGQPPVKLEMEDDDDGGDEDLNLDEEEEEDLDLADDEEELDLGADDGAEDSADENKDSDNTPPSSKEEWLEHAKNNFPGITDPSNVDELEKYAKENYGVDLDKKRKPVTLIKQIYALATKAE